MFLDLRNVPTSSSAMAQVGSSPGACVRSAHHRSSRIAASAFDVRPLPDRAVPLQGDLNGDGFGLLAELRQETGDRRIR
ncbi:hypothetical protein GCM10017673_32320 [Streptosporangium violaceochromogenes]|nr:hypothetical protein GCM10017673_32320 [Streptosporangium violaceochromogenes]